MELRQLKYFLTICETKNFTRAAERLYISQPALTNQINSLETELGMKLFNRTNKNVALTPTGEVFQTHARQVISEVDSTLCHIKEIKGEFQDSTLFFLHPFLSRLYFRDIAEIVGEQFPEREICFSVRQGIKGENNRSLKKFSFGIFLGIHGKMEESAVELVYSPVVQVLKSKSGRKKSDIYVVPGDTGKLTEEVVHSLPAQASVCEVSNIDNPMEYLLSERYVVLLPEAMLDFELPVYSYEPEVCAAIFLYCEDGYLRRKIQEPLRTYFLEKGWKKYEF